jgi:four helix bundle protein
MRDFRKLLVWQRAHALSVEVHDAIQRFPRREHTSLRSQLMRAAESIATNVVEGCAASTQREFARYLDIAIKSANETEYHLIAAADREAMPKLDSESMQQETMEIRRMLHALRKRVLISSAAL